MIVWGIRWKRGTEEGWYEHLGRVQLGTETDARDKAARRNDSDVEGKYYRAERYTASP
jgi:hypothetical protein